MEIHNCVQGSDEWRLARLGRITASNFSDVQNKGTGRDLYMRRLTAERVTGEPVETYKNAIMEKGSETESIAREYYEELYNIQIQQVGFISLDEWTGCSPDGLIGDDGLIEIKCPLVSTHVGYIINGKLPTTYIPQVQGVLWITGRIWCDFVSFSPQMRKQKLFVKRVERDEEYIKILKKNVNQFRAELQEMVNKLNNPY